ncbi:hypothetical protein RTG_02834 [Rhodotorula toruloides ATCC 204091]|uniref:Uncharacterized protein n=1 Tax=Rhodotorula toruloides TaxID=5286 RepID=A0A0K3C7R3_RHOTO|nr:hypothetical protein RTG_02834 [Rhodotorula toruloides ATCC 204091]KAK4335742.1 Glutaredoxin domain-containing protein [Rhodotorula toruloides]PRQ77731.1 hypothetical protein AAT19DRAFT_8799 [Rhodotorula toruloides]
MAPSIDVFVTSILSNPAIRGRHERVRRCLTSARVSYREHDVASDEAAKSMWKRKNCGKNELPCILVDGEPVGSIEDLDEAVEFGELRQFLRLDSPAAPPPASNPASSAAPSDSTPSAQPPASRPSGSTSSKFKTSIDDFADLNLSPSELAELAREIEAGETFSSALTPSTSSALDADGQGGEGGGFSFTSSATQRFDPVHSPTEPLKLEKVSFVRPLPDRPLHQAGTRADELEGIEGLDEVGEDELEKLARELEEMDAEFRRKKANRLSATKEEKPPMPDKSDSGLDDPPLPSKPLPPLTSPSNLAPDLASKTTIEGDGGASLSAPLVEIEPLRLSGREKARLEAEWGPREVQVQPVSELEKHVADTPLPSTDGDDARGATGRPTSTREAEAIKASLNGGQGDEASQMSHFGVEDMQPQTQGQRERGRDEVDERVINAIRGGDL